MKKITMGLAALIAAGTFAVGTVGTGQVAEAVTCSYSTSVSAGGVACPTSSPYRIKVYCREYNSGWTATVWGAVRSNNLWSMAQCPTAPNGKIAYRTGMSLIWV